MNSLQSESNQYFQIYPKLVNFFKQNLHAHCLANITRSLLFLGSHGFQFLKYFLPLYQFSLIDLSKLKFQFPYQSFFWAISIYKISPPSEHINICWTYYRPAENFYKVQSSTHPSSCNCHNVLKFFPLLPNRNSSCIYLRNFSPRLSDPFPPAHLPKTSTLLNPMLNSHFLSCLTSQKLWDFGYILLFEILSSLCFWNSILSYGSGHSPSVSYAGSYSPPRPQHVALFYVSLLGPLLFSINAESLGNIIQTHNLKCHLYVDLTGSQVYFFSLNPSPTHSASPLGYLRGISNLACPKLSSCTFHSLPCVHSWPFHLAESFSSLTACCTHQKILSALLSISIQNPGYSGHSTVITDLCPL